MRTKQEIERAVRHLEDSLRGAVSAGDGETISRIGPIHDILLWVLRRESRFAELLEGCDIIDAQEKHTRN